MIFWKNLHQAICSRLKEKIPAIQTCEVYPTIRKKIVAPAVFVELVSLEAGKDPGTGELALKARFEEMVIVDSTIENASLVVRSLAAEVARVVNQNTWETEKISPGEFISAEGGDFKPELDAYTVWMVEWVHQLHLSESIWLSNITPHSIEIDKVHVGP